MVCAVLECCCRKHCCTRGGHASHATSCGRARVWPCKGVVWFLHGMCGDTAVCVVTQMCEEQHHVCEERLALFPRLEDFWLLPAPA
jgi:hypothetical protein